ncbi:MAG: alpha/beta hydrolase family protein, partial [Marinicella sp.]
IGDAPTLSGGREARILAYEVDTNDNARFAFEYDTVDRKIRSDNKYYMHVRDYGGEWNAVDLEVSEKARPILNPLGFSNDNSKFYFSSNHDSPDSGIMGLFELYFADMELTLIKRHEDVDFERDSYIQSNLVKGVNGELIGVIYEAGYPVVHYIEGNGNDPEINLHKQLRSLFKGNEVLFSNSTLNKEKTLFKTYSDQNPGEFYLFDRTKNKVEYIASSRPKIKAAQMAKVEPFVMNARDDLKMYGQLTLPPGKEIKNLPMVVYPHGGPYGLKDVWRWDNTAQLLANNGYLVLQLNFRGSGGYGSKFEVEGYHEWGAKMQDDLTDATLWAIQQGYADADRICIHGSSYGGYASMQGIVKEPDLYKCAIADAGIYDNELQWKKADSFKANKKGREEYFRQMFGTHENKQLIDSRSPAYNTSGIKAAILLTHGTKDVRVPFENAEVLEKSLKENGIKYDTYFKKDGHGFSKEENRISFYKKMLEFLDKHIGK